LQLRDGLVLWDIGAGSGSISIEASRIAALHRSIALEKNVDRFRQLVENIGKFGGSPIEPVCGNAADLLASLPEPHRVFIGGSGGDLRGILEQVAARLRPGGRVVHTAVTLDTFEEMRSFWQGCGWKLDILQLQVNRSVPIGRSHRFEALNPVFVVTAVHPERVSG
jgi:precorrin-6Y C5,15-methyltransferase (decarboxylating)